jgi:hypothetical protein
MHGEGLWQHSGKLRSLNGNSNHPFTIPEKKMKVSERPSSGNLCLGLNFGTPQFRKFTFMAEFGFGTPQFRKFMFMAEFGFGTPEFRKFTFRGEFGFGTP